MEPGYQSPLKLGRILRILLIAWAAVAPAILILIGLRASWGAVLAFMLPAAAPFASVGGLLASLLGRAVFPAAIVFQSLWTYRLRQNLVALDVAGLHFTPGWAVAWSFVPVMNLFRPWQVMRETVQASQTMPVGADPQAWKVAPYSSLVHWWWWLPLVMNLLGVGGFVGILVVPIVGFGFPAPMPWYAYYLFIPSAIAQPVLTYFLVRQVTSLQDAKHAALAGTPAGLP